MKTMNNHRSLRMKTRKTVENTFENHEKPWKSKLWKLWKKLWKLSKLWKKKNLWKSWKPWKKPRVRHSFPKWSLTVHWVVYRIHLSLIHFLLQDCCYFWGGFLHDGASFHGDSPWNVSAGWEDPLAPTITLFSTTLNRLNETISSRQRGLLQKWSKANPGDHQFLVLGVLHPSSLLYPSGPLCHFKTKSLSEGTELPPSVELLQLLGFAIVFVWSPRGFFGLWFTSGSTRAFLAVCWGYPGVSATATLQGC